jgi:hypothetical protein
VGALLGGTSRIAQYDRIMRKPVISYVESSVPEYMTIADYRRSRPRRAPRRGLRSLLALGGPQFAA